MGLKCLLMLLIKTNVIFIMKVIKFSGMKLNKVYFLITEYFLGFECSEEAISFIKMCYFFS